MFAVALSHGLATGDGRLFHDPQELQREIGFQVGSRRVFHDRFFSLNFGCHMATKVQTEEPIVEHSPTANLETDLALEFLRVVEEAAIACGKTMGQGDRKHADQVATESMRGVMDSVPMDGTIVIGEGERDEAPMLYIGEKVGKRDGGSYPAVDIAVDPLEGTNLCATGSPGAITVLAASEHGGLLHAP